MSTDSSTSHAAELARRVSTLKDAVSGASGAPPAVDLVPQTLAELETALEELRVAEEELRQQNYELHAANLALEAERRRYLDLFEFAPDAYLVTDPHGVVEEANRAASQLLRIPREYLIGKPLSVFLPLPERRAFRHQLSSALLPQARAEWDTRVQPRSGEMVHVTVTVGAATVDGDNVRSLRWLVRDVSLRKAGEYALEQQRQWTALLHEVDQGVLRAETPAQVAELLARGMRRLIACDWVAVATVDAKAGELEILAVDAVQGPAVSPGRRVRTVQFLAPEQLHGLALVIGDGHRAEPLAGLAEILSEERLDSFLSIPVLTEGRLVGTLNLGYRKRVSWPADEIEMLRRAAAAMAVAFHHASLLAALQQRGAQLAALSARLVQAQEQERRAIARELHDEGGQGLAALSLGLGQIKRAAAGYPDVVDQAQQLEEVADKVMESLHRLARDLRPVALDRLGLIPAVRQLVGEVSQQHGLEIGFVVTGIDEGTRLAPEIETAAYRAVQESLTNVIRHAQASYVAVVLNRDGDRLIAIVEDNGVGFDPQMALRSGRLGLSGMQERMELLGGGLTVESTPGAGTTIFAELPCSAAASSLSDQPNSFGPGTVPGPA